MAHTRRRTRAHRQRARARRRVAATIAALALVISEAFGVAGAARTEARAVEPSDAITITSLELYSDSIGMSSEAHGPTGRFEANGMVVYCADAGLTGPRVGTTLSGREHGGLTLDYILHYGYGGAGYQGNVRGRTGEEAQAITQIAIWCATSAPNGDWEGRKLAGEGRAFYEEAQASARADGVYAGSSWIYGPRSEANQRITGQTLRTGNLELVKASADPAVSGDSELYTLAGATYGVYRDRACSEPVTTITTEADGAARAGGLAIGTYYLRETTPPHGYARNDTVYEVNVGAGRRATVTATDTPQVARVGMLVRKVDADTGQGLPQGDATLAGAEFTVRHYEGLYDDVSALPEQPAHTWVVRTGADGTASLDAAHLVSGDAILTDTEGNAVVPLGTVTVQETLAPEGYLLPEDGGISLRRVEAAGSTQVVGTLAEHVAREEAARGGVRVAKLDRERAEAVPQGDAALAGAELTVYNRSVASVMVDGDEVEPGEAALVITTGEDGVAASAADALPYGTYEIRETAAPRGYLPNEDWAQTFEVRADGQVCHLVDNAHALRDQVARGGVELRKGDRELVAAGAEDSSVALGSATLAGAVLELTNASANAVLVGDTLFEPGAVVATLVTDADGRAATAPDALPFGTYEAREATPPAGYLPNEDWVRTVRIEADGQVVDLTSNEEAVDDQVIRGDLSFTKAEEGSQRRMAGVAFLLTSLTTGERHVLVTDENGMADTSAAWFAHTSDTNASDAALREDGTVDDAALRADHGVWFSGGAETATAPDDALGALPFDRYHLEELPCAANEGHRLVATEVTITRPSVTLDLGTMDNKTEEEPRTPEVEGVEDAPAPEGIPRTGEAASVVMPVALAGVAAVGGSLAWRRRMR